MTSDDQNHGGSVRDEAIAGEYVLGVLSIEERRAVERRMVDDRNFAALVGRWQADMAPLNDEYRETVPDPALFGRIERRLFHAEPASSSAREVLNSVRFWRWVSFASSLVALASILFASGILRPPGTAGPIVAELSAPDNPVSLLASFDIAKGRLRIVPVAAGRPREKSLQLWLVPGSGNPRSLAVFEAGSQDELVIPADLRDAIGDGATLAVSLEPFGGSPTGLPTGPIVASGTARRP